MSLHNILEELGRDVVGSISSLPVIRHGKNRGRRKPETAGRWLCAGGYTVDSRWCEKNAHSSWLKTMREIGYRVGKYEFDGVVNIYLFMQDSTKKE